MSQRSPVDVIIMVYPQATSVLDCVRRLLEQSGDHLGRLILIEELRLSPDVADSLERLAGRDGRIQFVRYSSRLGAVGSCNRALTDCQGDVVLLSGNCMVSGNWLSELAAVAHSEERTACASPLMNGEGMCSLPELNQESIPDEAWANTVRQACAGLPRWTVAPALNSPCIYLRRSVIDAVGLLNPDFDSLRAAINNHVSQSQSLGFVPKRANHVYIHQISPRSGRTDVTTSADRQPPHSGQETADLVHQLKMFGRSLDGQLPAHAIGAQLTGKLRVALDIRYLTPEQVGTRTYAVRLANALAEFPEIDLTLLVNHGAQAEGLKGRVVTPKQWADGVAVIHRPAQVGEPDDLRLLFNSSAHVLITYQDLIAYRIPHAFSSDDEFDRYRTTSRLSLQGVQRVIAYSESAAREITAEFGIPGDEISVIPLGVDTEWFARREPRDKTILRRLKLPARYFFSLATDFPHKNLPNLLEAYSRLRDRWRGSEPPGLVLAGHTSSARTHFYANLESSALEKGLTFLGAVTSDQLKVLYQNAEALVFPSLYEGFGLPPLEAMAAGTPVIAMPISAVPEVGGDCVLYPDGLSALDLARAMESVATNPSLRDELRERGIKRVDHFRWENTARETVEAYRSAIMRPSPRSLQMRRNLREGILRWAVHLPHDGASSARELQENGWAPQSMGIRNAARALGVALHVRLKRQLAMGPFRNRPRNKRKQESAESFPGVESPKWALDSDRDPS